MGAKGDTMTALRDLAAELKMHRVSIAEHCRKRGIATCRRLPADVDGGQLVAHVSEQDAARIRAFYSDRLADVSG